ncbi:protein MODIFIER OF SNC1 1-like isoform X1 [Typha latifolia]|uniref:protein MODIFIER OF SNC1 1-like isoform X1 n=2 Tax=Typha latifolia TaxID=4733 RepID=UPI003C30776C
MASSILTADRRCVSTRKSGMTVLGKVPKPINLPSQRLENNGLDPNVEIVPKGTLTWGSRPSSAAASNAWHSSTLLSSKTDGSAGSPSHANSRPSSGGGTRPSTSDSDNSHDPTCAWGSNPRPSTASGLLASHHTSVASSRPQSAETRPSSSQLSRFADSSAENTIAWGSRRIAEKLGSTLSESNGFSLSSGDFPTLVSEKNSEPNNQRGHSLQGRPTSGSGRNVTPKEGCRAPINGDGNVVASPSPQNVNIAKADRHPDTGGGSRPNTNWDREVQQAQPFPNKDMAPHQFDSWHACPPIHSSDGIWYRGGASGGPYRPADLPGTFGIDPSDYYPHFPPNSEPLVRPRAGEVGYIPKDGDAYYPYLPPNSLTVPTHSVTPVRPGVCQIPGPYSGFYCPPQASFHNAGEKEAPFMAVAAQPGHFNQYRNQNDRFSPGEFQAEPDKHDLPLAKEQMESDRPHGAYPGHYRVSYKQQDSWEDNHDVRKGQPIRPILHFGQIVSEETASGDQKHTGSRKDEVLGKLGPDQKACLVATNCKGQYSHNVTKITQVNSIKADDCTLLRKSEGTSSIVCEHQPVIKKNGTLIENIEGLNYKARSADAQRDIGQFSSREDKTMQLKTVNIKVDQPTEDKCSNAVLSEIVSATDKVISVPSNLNSSSVESSAEVSTCGRAVLGSSESQVTLRTDQLGEMAHPNVLKRAIATGKELSGGNPLLITCVINAKDDPGIGDLICQSSQETISKESDDANSKGTDISSLDSLDHKAQRVKLKEMATQRAKQLQKEEEERAREQKAKALAKLEELNRRSSAQSVKKLNDALPPSDDLQHKQESGASITGKTDVLTSESPFAKSAENSDSSSVAVPNDTELIDVALAKLPARMASPCPEDVNKDSTSSYNPSLAKGQDTNVTDFITHKSGSHSHDNMVSKNKKMGNRRRQNYLKEKYPIEKPITPQNMENAKDHVEANVDTSNGDSLPHEDPSMQQKKRNLRNKNKVDDALVRSTLPTMLPNEENLERGFSDSSKTQSPASVAENILVNGLKATVEAHGRMGNHLKSQPFRKSARNQQCIRSIENFHQGEAIVWAPVKQSNKNEQSEENNDNNITVSSGQSSGKNDNYLHNVMKTKRVEMERYVPKPVANELLQQNSQQTSPSLNQVASGGMTREAHSNFRSLEEGTDDAFSFGKIKFASYTKNGVVNSSTMHGRMRADVSGQSNLVFRNLGKGKVDASVEKTEFPGDTKNGEENRTSRHGKTWRQRKPAESAMNLLFPSGHSISSDASKVQKSSYQHQTLELDSQPEKQFQSDGWNSTDYISVSSEPSTLPVSVKYQGVTSRQRSQQNKVHRFAGSNYALSDNKDVESGRDDKIDIKSSALVWSQSELREGSNFEKKNFGAEHPRSHWTPKSQIYSRNHQHGIRGNKGQRIASYGGTFDKEHPSQGFQSFTIDNEDNSDLAQKNGVNDSKDASHQEVEASKGQSDVVNLGISVEASADLVAQYELQVNPATHHHGRQNDGFSGGQELMYRGKDSGQHADKQNLRTGDNRKIRTHFEYQPVGSFNKPTVSSQTNRNVEETQEGHQVSGPRYRERGQNHSQRGGHFMRRGGGF